MLSEWMPIVLPGHCERDSEVKENSWLSVNSKSVSQVTDFYCLYSLRTWLERNHHSHFIAEDEAFRSFSNTAGSLPWSQE